MSHYYHMCRTNIGRMVCIRTHDGREYRGRISRVTRSHVLVTPVGRPIAIDGNDVNKATTALGDKQKQKGEEVFWPFFGWWLPFAAVASLAFVPFFFWW